jgi:hypothetical protein
MSSCVSNHPFFYPPCILCDKNFLFDGTSIKQGKYRIKKKNRAEGKGRKGPPHNYFRLIIDMDNESIQRYGNTIGELLDFLQRHRFRNESKQCAGEGTPHGPSPIISMFG